MTYKEMQDRKIQILSTLATFADRFCATLSCLKGANKILDDDKTGFDHDTSIKILISNYTRQATELIKELDEIEKDLLIQDKVKNILDDIFSDDTSYHEAEEKILELIKSLKEI
jgi:hypothetical protein